MSSLRVAAAAPIEAAWSHENCKDCRAVTDAVLAVIHDHIEGLRMAEPLHDPMPLYKEGANDMLNAVQALLSEGAA